MEIDIKLCCEKFVDFIDSKFLGVNYCPFCGTLIKAQNLKNEPWSIRIKCNVFCKWNNQDFCIVDQITIKDSSRYSYIFPKCISWECPDE